MMPAPTHTSPQPRPHRVSARLHRDRIGRRLRAAAGTDRERGMTLVELMIAAMLMLVLLGAVYGIWSGLDRTFAFTNDDLAAQEQARMAMGEMVEYIRTARVPADPPTEALDAVITSASPNQITLWTDVDRDPDHEPELIRFRVDEDTKTLWRDQAGNDGVFANGTATRLVSQNIRNSASRPLFQFQGSNDATLAADAMTGQVADPTDIRSVSIDLLVDVYVDQRPITHELTSIVQPRNLRQY
jgi:prepilin-type N-terminal cleavage/methylation domain-containing protein